MIKSIKELEELITKYNKKYFKGRLPPIPIHLIDSDDFKGGFCYNQEACCYNPHPHFFFSIPFLKKAEIKEIQAAVLHEMIHYFFWVFDIPDESFIIFGHSPRFKRVKRNLEKKEGIEIPLN